jgi:hypothetical protein
MRASTGPIWAVLVAAFIVALAPSAFAQSPAPPKPAVPLDALAAIVDAFKSHSLVALGETHGHLERQAFLHNLITDSRFAAVANDIVVEGGSSSCQELVDRFVSGEDVPLESLQRVWRNTTQGQAVPRNLVEVFQLVREINSMRPKARQLRVLLGEPPIDWDRADPAPDRNRFAARLVERDVQQHDRHDQYEGRGDEAEPDQAAPAAALLSQGIAYDGNRFNRTAATAPTFQLLGAV